MRRRTTFVLWRLILCLMFLPFFMAVTYCKDRKPLPEEIVARHLESLGKPEALAAVQSRTASGVARIRRPIGTVPQVLPEPGKQTDPINYLLASSGKSLGMLMKFYDKDYPAEHFAFDGKDATVAIVARNNRSVLGEFISRYSGMMREGLFGGVLSTAWPLLNIQGAAFKLKYDLIQDSNGKLHQLTYTPKSRKYLDNIVIHLFFDYETYRHVMTEYVLMGNVNPVSFVFEKFGNFREVDGLMLPHAYSIEYNTWRGISPTLWVAEIQRVLHNGPVDSQLFHAQ